MRPCLHSSVLVLCVLATAARADVVIDFEDLTLPASGYFNGDPGGMPIDRSWELSQPWFSGAVSFSNTSGRDVGESGGWAYNYTYWSGFASSNVVNTTDSSFTNQYAAKPGGGFGGAGTTYAVAFGDGAAVVLPGPTTVAGFQIANTTYAYGVMAFPDPNNFSTPLGLGDWFAVTAIGKLGTTTTNAATFYLADLRGASPPGILAEWAWFDLTGLGTVDRIEFSFDGSDKHPIFGLNTPAYLAMDNLTVAAVPEPATWTLLAGGAATALLAARRTHRSRRAGRGG